MQRVQQVVVKFSAGRAAPDEILSESVTLAALRSEAGEKSTEIVHSSARFLTLCEADPPNNHQPYVWQIPTYFPSAAA